MALLTPAEAREMIPALTNDDALLTTFIARAEQMLAKWCRFPAADAASAPQLEQQTYTMYLSGPSVLDRSRLFLPVRPVQSITTIHDDADRAFGASTLVPATDYELDATDGNVYLLPGATTAWSIGTRSIKVVAVCGIDPASTAVDVVKQAIASLTKHIWDLRHIQGNQGATQGGSTQNRREETIPATVRQMVSHLRMYEVGSG
jgi:hypothetical protein